MSKLRVGIVGTGSIAEARHIPGFQKQPDVELVAVADVSQSAVERAATRFQIPSHYTDYREMLAREQLDAISVCTPNKFHSAIAVAALDAGLHVFCEKPMAVNAAEAQAMADAAKRSGKILAIGYRYRYQPEAQAAKQIITDGELGDIYMVRVQALRRRGIPSWGTFTNKDIQGGGAMVDFGVHLLDLALWLLGNPAVVEVSGVVSQHLGTRPGVNEWGPWNHEKFEVEDHAAAFVRLAGGKALFIEASWALNIPEAVENVSLSGTEGGLEVFPLKINKAAHGMLLNSVASLLPNRNKVDWDLQISDFVQSILTGRHPLVRPEEALQVSTIVDAIYRSSDTGASVRFP